MGARNTFSVKLSESFRVVEDRNTVVTDGAGDGNRTRVLSLGS